MITTYIARNNLGDSTQPILQLLQSDNPLRILSLSACDIKDTGAKIILDGLERNDTLKSLTLSKLEYIYIYIYII